MRNSILYDIVAMAFSVLIIADYFASYRSKSVRNAYFRIMAILDLAILILDILTSLNGSNYGKLSLGFSTLLSTVYFSVYTLFFFFGCKYFQALINAEGEQTKTGIGAVIVLLLQFILLVFNQFQGFYFYYDHIGFHLGARFWLCMGMNLVFVCIMCMNALSHRQCFSQEKRAPYFLMIFLIIASSATQVLMYYGIAAGGYSTTICLMTVMFTIQRSESERLVTALEEYNDNLEKLLKEKARALTDVQSSIINGMADVITGKESYCEGHTARTTALVTLITDKMKKDPLIRRDRSFYTCVEKTAPLHDIGEISISDEILDNFNHLTDEEQKIYQSHTTAGAAAVRRIFANTSDSQMMTVAENIARYHHENYDGSGYPEGLKGEDIPLEARIVSMAEAFDLFMSQPENKNAGSIAEGLKMVWDNMNKLYDPTLVRFLFASRDAVSSLYEKERAAESRKEAR